MPVAQMLAVMPSSELTEWMAEDRIEPIGSIREDFRIGLLASILVSVNSTKDAKIPAPLSWFPWFAESKPKPRPPEDVSAGIMRLINAQTAAVERSRKAKAKRGV